MSTDNKLAQLIDKRRELAAKLAGVDLEIAMALRATVMPPAEPWTNRRHRPWPAKVPSSQPGKRVTDAYRHQAHGDDRLLLGCPACLCGGDCFPRVSVEARMSFHPARFATEKQIHPLPADVIFWVP